MASSVPASVQTYLASCNEEQLSAVLDVICKVGATAPLISQQQSEIGLQPKPVQHVTKSNKIKNSTKMTSSLTKTRINTAGSSVSKRPLNSFIAFRSYYAPIFPSQQQKEISGFLNTLWRADPFKAQWSILAKAYSLIRDLKGKEDAPLDEFLSCAAPFSKIIHPTEYLATLGWEFEDTDGVKTLKRNANAELVTPEEHSFSVEDTVSVCVTFGYITPQDKLDLGNLSGANTSFLSMATRPSRPSRRAALSTNTAMTQTFASNMNGSTSFVQNATVPTQAPIMSMPNSTPNTNFNNNVVGAFVTGSSVANNNQLQSSAITSGVTMSQVQNQVNVNNQNIPAGPTQQFGQLPQSVLSQFNYAYQAGQNGDYEFILDPLVGDGFDAFSISAYGTPYFNSYTVPQNWGYQGN